MSSLKTKLLESQENVQRAKRAQTEAEKIKSTLDANLKITQQRLDQLTVKHEVCVCLQLEVQYMISVEWVVNHPGKFSYFNTAIKWPIITVRHQTNIQAFNDMVCPLVLLDRQNGWLKASKQNVMRSSEYCICICKA